MLPIKHSSSRGKGMRESASPQREREINDWPLTHRPAHCGHNSGQPKCQVQHAADCWAESSLFVRDIGHHLFSYFVVHLENKTIASIAGFFFVCCCRRRPFVAIVRAGFRRQPLRHGHLVSPYQCFPLTCLCLCHSRHSLLVDYEECWKGLSRGIGAGVVSGRSKRSNPHLLFPSSMGRRNLFRDGNARRRSLCASPPYRHREESAEALRIAWQCHY